MIINEINNEIMIINQDKSNYYKMEKDLFGESSEGGVMIAYYSESKLRKVKVTYYGEMGQATFEYYLKDGEVIFIHRKVSNYNKPIYFSDSKVKSISTYKYYFFNENLLNSKEVDIEDANEFIVDFNNMIKGIKEYKLPDRTYTGDTVRCKYGSRCQDTGYVIKGSRTKGHVIHVNPPKNKNVPMEDDTP